MSKNGKAEGDPSIKAVATNRHALHDYAISDAVEAGLELKGPEVKSLRAGKVNLRDSFAKVEGEEIFLYNMHISPYEFETINAQDPVRPRRLLLHKKEIRWLASEVLNKHIALIPLKLYFKRGFAKVELGLGRGKRLYDKRRAVKEREARREMDRAMRAKWRGK